MTAALPLLAHADVVPCMARCSAGASKQFRAYIVKPLIVFCHIRTVRYPDVWKRGIFLRRGTQNNRQAISN